MTSDNGLPGTTAPIDAAAGALGSTAPARRGDDTPGRRVDGGSARRRVAAGLLAAVLGAAALAGCGADARQVTPVFRTPAASPGVVSASPTPYQGKAPTRSFDVDVRELDLSREGRKLATTVYYPDGAGRSPVVLFSHGLGGLPADYAPLLRRWAAAGFVVAAPAYPHTSGGASDYDVLDVVNQPADASFVIGKVLALDGRRGDAFFEHLATDRVAAAGHSAGGITTVGMFTLARDPRLDAGIVLSGNALGAGTGFRGAAAPMLFVHGERDETISYASGKAAYKAVPWPKAMLSFPKGDHGATLLRDDGASFEVLADATTEFLRYALYGDPAAKGRIGRAAAQGDVATLDDRL
ncbi:chlorophyllase [Asanoa sp. NPDC049573]|uniref:alpha/beta hydrolase family protein n=1 Tax=Asanoa sp. NPDC049573 TaxID=3155396 RepID=UPI0034122C49